MELYKDCVLTLVTMYSRWIYGITFNLQTGLPYFCREKNVNFVIKNMKSSVELKIPLHPVPSMSDLCFRPITVA